MSMESAMFSLCHGWAGEIPHFVGSPLWEKRSNERATEPAHFRPIELTSQAAWDSDAVFNTLRIIFIPSQMILCGLCTAGNLHASTSNAATKAWPRGGCEAWGSHPFSIRTRRAREVSAA